ncbi:HAD-IA family hydrolase, partial [Candidatus Parcubacteria bacterium]|nr:HAD-IA family hydrolase [Candidatus Parcubacteria bacterium]
MNQNKKLINSNIKALIFDIGGVLFLAKKNGKEKNLLSSFREACLLLGNFGIDASMFLEELISIYRQSSVGNISKEETMNLMSNVLKISPKEVERLFKNVYSNNTIENNELYNYVLDLKKDNYKIGILSNQFHLSKDVLVPNKYYKNFDALEISSDDKLKKPDEKAFILILEKLKVKPEESIFVDDKQENLDVAEKLKMKTIIFKNNTQFFSRLKELGIKGLSPITK